MPRQKSRMTRWMEAAGKARTAFESVQSAADELSGALMELREIQTEYEDWQSNLPENLQQSALGEKLDAILQLDIESCADDPLSDWSTTEQAIDEAEAAELPLGFGRD